MRASRSLAVKSIIMAVVHMAVVDTVDMAVVDTVDMSVVDTVDMAEAALARAAMAVAMSVE